MGKTVRFNIKKLGGWENAVSNLENHIKSIFDLNLLDINIKFVQNFGSGEIALFYIKYESLKEKFVVYKKNLPVCENSSITEVLENAVNILSNQMFEENKEYESLKNNTVEGYIRFFKKTGSFVFV